MPPTCSCTSIDCVLPTSTDGAALVSFEARELRRHLVRARRQGAHEERPVASADDLAELTRRLVFRDHAHTRQHRVLCVHDLAAQLTRALLGVGYASCP